MAKKYYSINSAKNIPYGDNQDIPLYSYGLAVPRTGLQACLCEDKLTYSRKCCKGFLINQGIGNITGTGSVSPTPSPSISPTPSVTPSITPSITISITPTPSITSTVGVSTTPTPTPSVTATLSITPTPTRTTTPTPTVTPSATVPANDPDAQAFINATGITGSYASAINTLVVNLKNANLWNKMDRIYPFVGGTADTHKYMLKNTGSAFTASYSQTAPNIITHSSLGVKITQGPGANFGYIAVPFNVATELTRGDSHLSLYTTVSGGLKASPQDIDCGAYNFSTNTGIFIATKLSNITGYTGSRASMYRNSMDAGVLPRTGSWFVSADNSSSSFYYNGGPGVGVAGTSASIVLSNPGPLTTGSIYTIGGLWNLSSSVLDYETDNTYGFHTIGKNLTPSEISSSYNIIQTYQTSLGRQV